MADDDTTTGEIDEPADLDAVAAAIAGRFVPLLRIGPRRGGRVDTLTRRGGALGIVVGLAVGAAAAGAAIVATVAAARRGHAIPDVVGSYRRLTGADRDRAEADLALVERRLNVLVPALGELRRAAGGAGAGVDDAPAVVEAAARRLVHWGAAGRPDDPRLEAVRLIGDRLLDLMEASGRHGAEPLEAASAAYVTAWRTALA